MIDASSVKVLRIDDTVRNTLEEYIHVNLQDQNPYHAQPAVAEEAAHYLWKLIKQRHDQLANSSKGCDDLYRLVTSASNGENIPAILLKNCAREPAQSAVMPDAVRGYNYSTSEKDRMKKHFFTEWSSWIFAILLNHEATVHPAEHGGGNRFHLVSPISLKDERMRSIGASTGGGKFHQHSDATVYNTFKDRDGFNAEMDKLGTDVGTIEKVIGISGEKIVNQIFCGKYIRVDATSLAGIFNKDTTTHITSPRNLQIFLKNAGYGNGDFQRLSQMPVAHLAGPADGDISGYVGTITPPLKLDDHGDIFGTCLNLAENRMKYVGRLEADRDLFERFVDDARQAPVEEILVEASDILFFPNAYYGAQQNVTHGRGALQDSDYSIEVEPNVFVRRAHCRQYMVSRARDKKPSFLSKAG